MDIFVDSPDSFPITRPLSAYCQVKDVREIASMSSKWSAAVVDIVDDHLLSFLPDDLRAISVVHNPFQAASTAMVNRCDTFLCLTEYAFEEKLKMFKPPKLAFAPQGVDLRRFTVGPAQENRSEGKKRVLVYSRLDEEKHETLNKVIWALAELDIDLTVLGDGDGFWSISDHLAHKVTLINFIPCHSIHRIFKDYDLVVSSGRGVMEALASGKPAICAGRSYGGPVLKLNIDMLHRFNFTKSEGAQYAIHNLAVHIDSALSLSPSTCRRLAEQLFDVDNFVLKVFELANQSASN